MKVTIREYEEDPLRGDSKGGESSLLKSFNNEYIVAEDDKVTHNLSKGSLPTRSLSKGLCSYWRGVVSTKAVLEASGVGNADATAFSAAMNWALRDGTGMIGGLVFSYCSSRYFDTHVKEFRLFADVINDVALTLDMLAPAAGDYSILVLSLSTICKTMCGMSAGATKGRITQHFARANGNMADLTAKESTQETLVSLLGMLGGIFVARMLEHTPKWVTWFMFWALTAVHVWANYKGVLALKLATLNPERTQVLLKDIIQAIANDYAAEIQLISNGKETKDLFADPISPSLQSAMEHIPNPDQISESFLSSVSTIFYPTLLVSKPLDPRRLDCLDIFKQEKYVLGRGGGRCVYVWLCGGGTKRDEFQAYVHATVVQKLLDQGESWNPDLVRRSLSHVRRLFVESSKVNLMDCLEAKGWDLQSRLYLGFSQARILWSDDAKEE
eukprot:scaffold1375_cov137-Cylindrotheca_fusiformis.AAC.14